MVARVSPLTHLRWRRRIRSLAGLLLLFGLACAAWVWLPTPAFSVRPVHVIDGDSLTVRHDSASLTIRLAGIDAVEYRQDCTRSGAVWPCGRDARSALDKLVGHGSVHCELGSKDRYGRTLATCRTAPLPDGVDIGAEMVRQGWAVTTDGAYMVEEAEAGARQRGIWQGRFVRPADWRATHEPPATAAPRPDA
ncbi:thermonuclease family protein [Sphingopyxis sp. RIFCSPHIGHO2_12_FULL_65_19]|uniref:thermonuclease family protein n=1 Tax=Sphingopyxis sp. RIFCSPHIGHO2_12_FULL_65_19 TaxID=1802172 RepID=UPI000A775038|nr:thermonuclease family protein [Sphingopyxis sp. RIFCSPHIGHO2_12_FULL_65_19]